MLELLGSSSVGEFCAACRKEFVRIRVKQTMREVGFEGWGDEEMLCYYRLDCKFDCYNYVYRSSDLMFCYLLRRL